MTRQMGSGDQATDALWEWDLWAIRLRERFFNRAFSGEPVTLSVDREELAAIFNRDVMDPVEALAIAVGSQVMPGFQFEGVRRATEQWLDAERAGPSSDSPCPALPLLALNVLVASEMTSGGQQGAPNFYIPLRRLLGDEIGSGVPGDYSSHVPQCWEALSTWLDDVLAGARGFSTISRHDQFVNIGYATQQAVLRASDRRRLGRFFRAVGVEPGDEVVPAELRRALAVWARRQGPAGVRLHRLATEHEKYADRLLPVLVQRWDGKIRHERTGVVAAPLRLWIQQAPTFELGLVAVSPVTATDLVGDDERGVDPLVVEGTEGDPISPVPLPLDVDADVLDGGLSLEGDEMALYLEAADAYLFRRVEAFYPAWTSTLSVRFGERHVLLVRSERHRRILDWLETEGSGDAKVAKSVTSELPPGWLLIVGVRLDHYPSISPPPELADLVRSSGGTRLRLEGGLEVMRRVYLTFGAPLLLVPDSEPPQFTIGFDEQEIERDGSTPFALHEFTRWEGEYTVRHKLGELRLNAIEQWSEVPGEGVGSVQHRIETRQGISGLVVEAVPPAPPIVVETSGNAGEILVAADGSLAPVRRPDWLPFAVEATVLTHWSDFRPVWRLEPGESGGRIARLVEPALPRVPPVDRGHDLVADATLPDDETDEAFHLWCQYQEAADV